MLAVPTFRDIAGETADEHVSGFTWLADAEVFCLFSDKYIFMVFYTTISPYILQ